MIYLSYSSWSSFRIRFVKIAYFFAGCFCSWTEGIDANEGRASLKLLISVKGEIAVVVAMLSLLTGMDILGLFLAWTADEYLRESLRSKGAQFSLWDMID